MSAIKLGNYAHISIAVQSLRESSLFYEKAGFRNLWGNNEPHPWALYTDGRVNLHLYEHVFPSPALHYFSSHMRDKVLELMRIGIKTEQQKSRDGVRLQHTFFDPNEMCVMLMHHNDKEMPRPDGKSHCLLGEFGELSLSVSNLGQSLEFWQKLDFAPSASSDKPYPWAIVSDGTITLGLHQTTGLSEPAITFFSGDIQRTIGELKSASLEPLRELKNENGETEGAALTSPDGQALLVLKGSTQPSQNEETK